MPEKTLPEKKGVNRRTSQWDRNGRRKTEGEKKRGRRQQSEDGVVVVKDRGGRGGGIEKVTTIQQDHQTKKQLSLETQQRQETCQNNSQLKVSNQKF